MAGCKWDELCLETIDMAWWGVLIEVLVLLYSFLGLAKVADEWMSTSLETLCVKWNVREDVAGASFLALGSAAPEIVINLVVVLKSLDEGTDIADLGVASIFGSGMIAFLLILGVVGVGTKETLEVKRRPLLRDIIFYNISLLMLVWFFSDGIIDVVEGALLVVLYAVYLLVLFFAPEIRRRWQIYVHERKGLTMTRKKSFVLRQKEREAERARQLRNHAEASSRAADGEEDHQDAEAPLLADVDEQAALADVEAVATVVEEEEEAEGDEMEEEHGPVGRVVARMGIPFDVLFKWTMPNVELGTPHERWYALTFFISFIWVALFSFVISAIVSRWVVLSGASMAVFGLTVIALGAQVPDTLSSMAVARRGYGSMAVSNSLGSQIVNILIGLGLPWLMVGIFGSNVSIHDHERLLLAAGFMFGCTLVPLFLLLGHALYKRAGKATLDRTKGWILMILYPLTVAAYILVERFGYHLST